MHAWINLSHPGFSGRADKPDDGDEWIPWEEMARIVKAHKEPDQLTSEVQRLRSAVDLLGKFSESAVFVIADLAKGGHATGSIPASDAGQWAIHEDGSVFHIEPGKPGPDGNSWTLACAAGILKAREAEKQKSRVSSVDRFASCPKNEVCTPVGCEAGGGEWPRCPKEGMVQISAEGFKAMRIAGTMLANAAYNLKQQSSLNPEWRISLAEGQKAWDSATEALRANQGGAAT